jgi:uncharacterized protein YutE (UPF0331/DUF86 family)
MMKQTPINADKMRNLIADIHKNTKALSVLVSLGQEEFLSDYNNYGLAEHHLRRALEGILTTGTHILSRLPSKTKDYQEIITSLAEHNIIPKDFAEKNKKLAGYRNRLVHIYWEVSKEEMFNVIKEHIGDIEQFAEYFQEILQNPEKFNLKFEE